MNEEMEVLRRLAAAQHGVLLSSALRGLGVTKAQERRLRSEGWLVPVLPGTVLVGGGVPSAWQRVVAAWVLTGPGAVVSHWTAARVHKLVCVAPPQPDDEVELTVAGASHRAPGGYLVHRCVRLPATSRMDHRGVVVTTPTRTLVDLLPRLAVRMVAKTVDEGLIGGLWRPDQLTRALAESKGRAGIDRLRVVLAERRLEPGADRSIPLEVRAEKALACFAPFESQYQVVAGNRVYVLDIAWPGALVAAECDGWLPRARSRSKFDHERRRDNLLVAAGWTIVRLTTAMSDDEMRAAVHGALLRAAAVSR